MSDAGELYRTLLSSGRLPTLRRLTYRCAERRCLLLDVIDAEPLGVVCHQTRYKYSEGENLTRSSEDGRRVNTLDGERHWRERSYWLGQSALAYPDDTPDMVLEVTCDHVLGHRLKAADFRADWERHAREVRVARDGARYAVT